MSIFHKNKPSRAISQLLALPKEILKYILQADHKYGCYFGRLTNNQLEHTPSCMCATSTFYRDLRLVCSAFEEIVRPQVEAFTSINHKFSKDLTFEHIEFLANRSHLAICVHSYVCLLDNDLIDVMSNNIYEELAFDDIHAMPISSENESQIDFLTSDDICSRWTRLLTCFPSLKTIELRVADSDLFGVASLSLTRRNLPSYHRLGLLAMRVILQTCHRRVIMPSVCPIRELVIQGLCDEALYLSPRELLEAFEGAKSIQIIELLGQASLEIPLHQIQPLDNVSMKPNYVTQPWVGILGRLLRSSTELKEMRIYICVDHIEPFEYMPLEEIILVKSKTLAEHSIYHWPRLHSLTCTRVGVQQKSFYDFLVTHKDTLRSLDLYECWMRDRVENNPWITMFHEVKHVYAGRMQDVQLSDLKWGEAKTFMSWIDCWELAEFITSPAKL